MERKFFSQPYTSLAQAVSASLAGGSLNLNLDQEHWQVMLQIQESSGLDRASPRAS